ncbi:MAG TPA: aldo/keto reductase, partial [Kofleriaceae bacterium]
DMRAHLPRFAGENGERNQRLVAALDRIAGARGVRPSQLAIAWVLAKGSSSVPVIGARTRRQLDESLAALAIQLTPGELAEIEQAVPASEVAGTRYAGPQMQMLDSER